MSVRPGETLACANRGFITPAFVLWQLWPASVLVRGKPVVRVKNILGDDIYGLWHVKKIMVHKHGQRYALVPNKETFRTKHEAEHYAHLRTRRFIERELGRNNNNTVQWRAAMKYLFTAAFISVLTGVAVQWWRDQS